MIKMNFSLTKEPPPRNFKLADADIATLLRGLESGQFTSEELVKVSTLGQSLSLSRES